MITKDRYSQAFLFLTIGIGASTYFLRNEKGYLAAASLLIGIAPLAYLFTRPAKLHLSEDQKKQLKAEYKGEDDCKFSPEYKQEIDGIKITGKRYKFVNGTDVCVNEQNDVITCGIGSSIMQVIGGGGVEPQSIQADQCW